MFPLESLIFKLQQEVLKFNNVCVESAKLGALRAKNVLVSQRALRAYVLTCIHALCAYVLT